MTLVRGMEAHVAQERPQERPKCDLPHDRPRVATVWVQIKSTRVGRPGRPMVRAAVLCTAHARQLRDLGFEVVGT